MTSKFDSKLGVGLIGVAIFVVEQEPTKDANRASATNRVRRLLIKVLSRSTFLEVLTLRRDDPDTVSSARLAK